MSHKGRPGRFITVEGGEGVGKSLFVNSLAAKLRVQGRTVITTREPGGTPTADKIRALFATPAPGDPLLMTTEALLVSAARAQHVGRLITPALERGDWVLCDRFADSTRVYQGALGGLPATSLETLIAFSVGDVVPDVTFLLDCDISIALERMQTRDGKTRDAITRYDSQTTAFHQRLREAYVELAKAESQRWIRLDAAQAPDAVVEQAFRALEQRFGTR